MKQRFYIQISIVLVSAICLSSLYYYAVCAGLRSSKEGAPGKMSYTLYDTTRYDALFLGSSRVSRNINALEFTSLTGLSSFNAGIDGAGLTTTALLGKKFVQARKSVKYVFINLDTYTLENDSALFYYPMYYPHLADDDVYALSDIEKSLRLGRYAPFLAVSYIDDNLKGVSADSYIGTWPDGDTIYREKGFEPINSSDYKGTSDTSTLSFQCDVRNFKKLEELCAYFTQRGCKVVFIMAPIYGAINRATENSTAYYEKLRAVESKYGVNELNYYCDQRFSHEKFYNHTHLNHAGADLYTHLLADTILKIERAPK